MEELDRRIIGLLSQDGRMSFTDLGKVTGLSTSAVHQRVRKLEERGVIRGYRAVLDQDAPDATAAIVDGLGRILALDVFVDVSQEPTDEPAA